MTQTKSTINVTVKLDGGRFFYFFGELLTISGNRPANVVDEYHLKRPNSYQLRIVRAFIQGLVSSRGAWLNPFENERRKGQLHKSDEHRYWILENRRKVAGADPDKMLEAAMCLSSCSLTPVILAKASKSSKTYLMRNAAFASEIRNVHWPETELGPQQIKEIRTLHSSIKRFYQLFDDPKYSFISEALTDFVRLKAVPSTLALKTLGYFAVLEQLLARAKEKRIKDQLGAKVALLDNIGKSRLDWRSYFSPRPNTDTLQTIVDALYDVRNAIAHGRKDGEATKWMKPNDHTAVRPFLHELLRRVLEKCILDPVLVHDVKQC